jgi:hypothetical protein
MEEIAMKRLLMMVALGLACFACGNDCDEAADKLEECGYEGDGEANTEECDGANECFAKCVNDHSCAEINSADISGPFFACVAACA